jgi:hypothetical protein
VEELSHETLGAPAPARPYKSRHARLGWALLGLLPLAVIATAAFLTPDPAGHGTHVQLGLPPCGFLVVTGFPCPGCGLTTCFAHMVRLEIPAAAHANAFGVPLFLASLFTIPVAALGFFRSLPVLPTLERLHFEKVVILLAFASVAVWVVRIATLLAFG